MKNLQQSACRSCGAAIVWAVSTSSGKRMPLDAEPTAQGNVILDSATEPYSAVVQRGPIADGSGHLSHFVTCPNAASWRKKK